jgi:hypothetical protein
VCSHQVLDVADVSLLTSFLECCIFKRLHIDDDHHLLLHVHEGLGMFPVFNPQDEVGPSISSSLVLCSFVILVYIVVLVLVFYLCPSSVRVVVTFSSTTY